jgi:hypothetical protein
MRALPLVSVVVSLVVSVLATAAPSVAGPLSDSVKNVRPRDTTATMLLQFGHERSARFREIVAALEASNVIVYIDVRQESDHPVSGGLTFVGEAHGIRWVRATVDSGTASFIRTCQDVVRLTSILGHELQHALEASQAPSLVDEHEFATYFRSIGVDEGPHVLDTLAARRTGSQVADELRGMARRRGDVTLATTEAVPAVDQARADTGS